MPVCTCVPKNISTMQPQLQASLQESIVDRMATADAESTRFASHTPACPASGTSCKKRRDPGETTQLTFGGQIRSWDEQLRVSLHWALSLQGKYGVYGLASSLSTGNSMQMRACRSSVSSSNNRPGPYTASYVAAHSISGDSPKMKVVQATRRRRLPGLRLAGRLIALWGSQGWTCVVERLAGLAADTVWSNENPEAKDDQ